MRVKWEREGELVFNGEGLMKVFHLQFRKVKNTEMEDGEICTR